MSLTSGAFRGGCERLRGEYFQTRFEAGTREMRVGVWKTSSLLASPRSPQSRKKEKHERDAGHDAAWQACQKRSFWDVYFPEKQDPRGEA